MNRKSGVIWGAVLIGCIVAGVVSYRTFLSSQPSTAPAAKPRTAAPVAVSVALAKPKPWADIVSVVGSLRADQSVMLRPEVTGRVQAIRFEEGRNVRKGQLLIQLDDVVHQAEVSQARAELAVARSNLKRTEELAERQFLSPRALEEQKSSVQVLEAKLKVATAHASKMRLTAPFDGVAGLRRVSLGEYVKEGADLVAIDDLRRLKAEFRFPERFLPRLARGQRVELTTDALPDRGFTAQVDAVDPVVEAAGRSVAVIARVDNPKGELRPGMFVRVELRLGEDVMALAVPEEAIVPQGSNAYIYRVSQGQATRVKVKTGARQDGQVQVLSGLADGDVVVTKGHMRLQSDTSPVRVVEGAPT